MFAICILHAVWCRKQCWAETAVGSTTDQARFVQVWERDMMLLTMASLARMTTVEASPKWVAHDVSSWWPCQVLAFMFAHTTNYIPAGKRCCSQSVACIAVLIHKRRARTRGSSDTHVPGLCKHTSLRTEYHAASITSRKFVLPTKP